MGDCPSGRMASCGPIGYDFVLSVNRIDRSRRKMIVGGVSPVFAEMVAIEWAGCRV